MALAILVVLGVGLQVVVATMAGRRQAVRAAGAGSVAVGGTVHGPVTTRVSGPTGNATDVAIAADAAAVTASGAGGVAVGGDVGGAVETTVEGDVDGRLP